MSDRLVTRVVLVGLAAGLVLAATAVGVVVAVVRTDNARLRAEVDRVERERDAERRRVKAQQQPAPVVRPKVVKKGEEKEPVEPVTFEDVWKEAVKIGEERVKAEPERTKAQRHLLTAPEAAEADAYLTLTARDLAFTSGDSRSPLSRLRALGFADFISARGFSEGRSGESEVLQRRFWRAGVSARELCDNITAWGLTNQIDREMVDRAVQNGTRAADLTPRTRDVFLSIGGADWLVRPPENR